MSEHDETHHGTKLVIDPVTRVEGHGKVTIRLNDAGVVEQARFHIVEFRGFEWFVRGHMYWESQAIIQRLCGICPISHHLAAAKAMDIIAGVDRISPTAEKMRRLMHYGQILQSNAVHFFHLSSPDLLFGYDAPALRRNIFRVIEEYPEVGKWAIFIRKYGQEIIKATGGKKIHATGAVPGGINQNLSIETRDALRKDVAQIIDWCSEALALCKKLVFTDARHYQEFASIPSNYMSLVRPDGALDLYDGVLRVIDPDGAILIDGTTPMEYRDYLAEEVRPWSYMKFPFLKSLGPERGWYRVGPLAQLNCCTYLDTPLAEEERQHFKAPANGKPIHATLGYHWARVILMLHAVEVIQRLLDDDDLQGTELIRHGQRRPEAAAWLEAPRGTLIHHYQVDDDDKITMANLIVATTHNNEGMNRSVQQVARDELSGQEISEGLLNHIEVAIRAYDPCLSCATHTHGSMPLDVILEAPDGSIIARTHRHAHPDPGAPHDALEATMERSR